MSMVSVREAARRLGVDESRVRQRIADGSLHAERVGGRWVIDDADLEPLRESGHGRPLSPRSAWAVVDAAAVYPAKSQDRGLSASDRLLARKRLAALIGVAPKAESEESVRRFAASLRSLLGNRADRRLYRASPRDLPDLRDDDRLILSGLSHPDSGIASAEIVEGYVASEDSAALVADYLLSEDRGGRANVVLHVVPSLIPPVIQRDHSLRADSAWLALAADLAEHRGPREEARALAIAKKALLSAGKH